MRTSHGSVASSCLEGCLRKEIQKVFKKLILLTKLRCRKFYLCKHGQEMVKMAPELPKNLSRNSLWRPQPSTMRAKNFNLDANVYHPPTRIFSQAFLRFSWPNSLPRTPLLLKHLIDSLHLIIRLKMKCKGNLNVHL